MIIEIPKLSAFPDEPTKSTSDYTVDTQYFASLPMLCSQFAAVLGCEFTQEEFIDHCTTYGSDYPRMQYTKGGVENEIRFRDSSFGDYHQTVYSVSILLLQDAPGAEAKESEKKEASDENTLAAAANIAPEQITVPSSPEAQTYAEAERLLAAGDIAHAAMAFGRITGYKDAWERSSALWREITKGNDVIATGNSQSVFLREDGTVVAVGANSSGSGECNVSTWKNIIAVAAGGSSTFGLCKDGTVLATGLSNYGQCNVSGWNNIVAVAAGDTHAVGLQSDGTVVAVGNSNSGRCDVERWRNIVDIAAGENHTVGLKLDGTVIATGANDYGACNTNTWTNIVAIAAGRRHTLGLKADGTVISTDYTGPSSWYCGQCDVSSWSDIVAISAARYHTVGLRTDGTVIATKNIGPQSVNNGQCNVNNWTDIVAITAGGGAWGSQTLGLKSDGTAIATEYLEKEKYYYGQCEVSGIRNIKLPNYQTTRVTQIQIATDKSYTESALDEHFNYTVLQNEPGYIYDKFDDYWTWYAAYDEAYTDANLLIGIQLEGEVGGSDLAGVTLYTKIRNKDNRVIDGVQSMAFLVDGVKYSFPEMPGEDGTMAGSVVLYKNGYELIKAFANAKEVSVKLKLFSGGTVLLDLDSAQFDRTLGNMCRKILQYKVWDHYIENPAVEMLEMMFPMEITRK